MTLSYRGFEVTRKSDNQFVVSFKDLQLTYEKLSDALEAIDKLKMKRVMEALAKTLEGAR